MVRTLKSQGCNLIICLSHIGYDYPHESHRVSDLKLAAATENIDLIIGGHTHTFLGAPQIMANRKGSQLLYLNLAGEELYWDESMSKCRTNKRFGPIKPICLMKICMH